MQQNKRSRGGGGGEGPTGELADLQIRWKQDMLKVKTAWSTRYDALKHSHSEIKKQLQQQIAEARSETEAWRSVLRTHIPNLASIETLTPAALEEHFAANPIASSSNQTSEPSPLIGEIEKLKAAISQKEEETCLLIAEVQRLAASKQCSDENDRMTTNVSDNSMIKQVDLLQKRLVNVKKEANAQMALLQSAILSLLGWEIMSHKIIAEEICDSAGSEPQSEKKRTYQIQLRPTYKSLDDLGDILVHLDVAELAQQIRNKDLRVYVETRLRATCLLSGSGQDGPWDISNNASKQCLRFNGRLQTRWLQQRWRDIFASRKQLPSLLAVVLLDEQLALMKLQGRVASRDLKLKEVLAEELSS